MLIDRNDGCMQADNAKVRLTESPSPQIEVLFVENRAGENSALALMTVPHHVLILHLLTQIGDTSQLLLIHTQIRDPPTHS